MKTLLLCATILAAFSTSAWAGSYYDYQSGNMYNWNSTPGGDTHVNGYNLNNGSTWNQTIKPNGDQSGFDARGNYWNYNAGSGTYMNLGTGQMCTGHGLGRICN